jgi:frataxin-like iron-binding protein CyaY
MISHSVRRCSYFSKPIRRSLSLFPSELDFHHQADRALDRLADAIEKHEMELDLDVNLSVSSHGPLRLWMGGFTLPVSSQQGVLGVSSELRNMTWVINKQTPNQQIWWSSPIR